MVFQKDHEKNKITLKFDKIAEYIPAYEKIESMFKRGCSRLDVERYTINIFHVKAFGSQIISFCVFDFNVMAVQL